MAGSVRHQARDRPRLKVRETQSGAASVAIEERASPWGWSRYSLESAKTGSRRPAGVPVSLPHTP